MQQETADHKVTVYPLAKQKRKHKLRITLLVIIAAIILLRIFLPYIVLKYVNNKLSKLDEYYGHVNDIDIALLRGAYVIKEIKIVKINENPKIKDTIPFFVAPVIDLSVEWSAIFKGAFVGEIYVEDPKINFVRGTHKGENVKADTADFRQLIKDLMPLTVNHFEISNGQIHYIDKSVSPALNLAMTDINATAVNLSNVEKEGTVLPAHLDAAGNIYGGKFTLKIDFDALKKMPTFDMSAELTQLQLPQINDLLKAYGNFEVERGTFGLYTEFAAKDGKYGGYVKPLIKDMKVALWKKDEGLKAKLWELMVSGISKLLKNRKTENIATKVDISGTFNNSDINTWRAVSYLLKNAFVRALAPSVDQSISINNLNEETPKTFLEKVFEKKKK
jgi:branched-subunit amino acid transport protein AzlD